MVLNALLDSFLPQSGKNVGLKGLKITTLVELLNDRLRLVLWRRHDISTQLISIGSGCQVNAQWRWLVCLPTHRAHRWLTGLLQLTHADTQTHVDQRWECLASPRWAERRINIAHRRSNKNQKVKTKLVGYSRFNFPLSPIHTSNNVKATVLLIQATL